MKQGMQVAIIEKDGTVHGVATPFLRIEVTDEAIDVLKDETMVPTAYLEDIIPNRIWLLDTEHGRAISMVDRGKRDTNSTFNHVSCWNDMHRFPSRVEHNIVYWAHSLQEGRGKGSQTSLRIRPSDHVIDMHDGVVEIQRHQWAHRIRCDGVAQ